MRTVDLELRDVVDGSGVVGRSVSVDERQLEYARYLSEEDRVLVELGLRRGLTRSEIARVTGSTPGAVSRRIRRIERRLADPLVEALLEAEETEVARLHRAIGIAHFLTGRSAADLAREMVMSPGQVREVIAYLRGWEKGRRGRGET